MAGSGAERQETGLVNAINRAVTNNGGKGIKIQTPGASLTNIIRAQKYGGRSSAGTEPYTDVVLYSQGGRKWNLSMKGESAPSLAGGGLEGLELIVPGIGGKFLKAAYRAYIRAGYKRGDDLPDAYATVPTNLTSKIVVGTAAMGGPIHYMYQGPMDVTSRFNKTNGILTVNGKLTSSGVFAKQYKLIFRLRRRRQDRKFLIETDKGGKDKRGLPMITQGRRIMIVDSMPSQAFKVRI
tara:strand:+ start:1227 stop:1940 length:714 start_codon:yes stop_codon:yes gene_type:complete